MIYTIEASDPEKAKRQGFHWCIFFLPCLSLSLSQYIRSGNRRAFSFHGGTFARSLSVSIDLINTSEMYGIVQQRPLVAEERPALRTMHFASSCGRVPLKMARAGAQEECKKALRVAKATVQEVAQHLPKGRSRKPPPSFPLFSNTSALTSSLLSRAKFYMQSFSNTLFGRTLLGSNFGGLLFEQTFVSTLLPSQQCPGMSQKWSGVLCPTFRVKI